MTLVSSLLILSSEELITVCCQGGKLVCKHLLVIKRGAVCILDFAKFILIIQWNRGHSLA